MQTLFTPAEELEAQDVGAALDGVELPPRSFALSLLQRRVIAFVTFWCATLLMLHLSGAFTHELGGAPDEAAHFMTGLMIHDYVASGMKKAPLDFASEYYTHYPKVAFGIWPPLFHVMEAAWMLVISPSKGSVLFMLSGITALLGYLLYRVMEPLFGYAAAIAAGLLLVSAPLTQQSTSLIMVDSSVALFSFLAVSRFARYLDSGDWRHAALFGIWASAAILSKYNGLALALVPLLCAAFTGRWHLLWRGPTLLAGAIVCAICGSWYLPMWRMISYAAEPQPRLATVLPALKANTSVLAGMLGIPMLIVAGAGVALTLLRPSRGRSPGIWVSAGALIVSWWIFHSVTVPDPEPRYLLPVLPALILFVAAGVQNLSQHSRFPPVVLAGALLVAYTAGSFTVVRTPHFGYGEVASAITSQHDPARNVVLANGAAEGEGMAVAAIAIRERRLGHYVLRGSKVLATGTWTGGKYRTLYRTPREVLQALDAMGVSTVILQLDTPVELPHHRLLAEALHSATGRWQRWSDASWSRYERYVQVYRRIRQISGPFCLDLSLEETLHRRLPICIQDR